MTLIHSKSSEFDMDKYYLSVYEKQPHHMLYNY
jgi:hypothetical protein